MDNVIMVYTKENPFKLEFFEKTFTTEVLIGKNGATLNKKEGDGKTPIGEFETGIAFGMHESENVNLDESVQYVKINENLYWIDDVNSKYYNRLIDVTKVNVDWKSAERLIDYKVQYEFALEVKTNPQNIAGKGSAIFIHCSDGNQTAGCIALPREKMIELLSKIDKNTKVCIV